MKTLTTKLPSHGATANNLTPFDRLMITEAYARCYGLQDAIKFDIPDALQSLAHQTGFRLKFLIDNLDEIKQI